MRFDIIKDLKGKRGQVWIETVIYSLMGLVLIALVLVFIMPKITQARDKLVVEQSIEALNIFDLKLQEVREGAAGSTRIISAFQLKKGRFIIDGKTNSLLIVLEDLKKEYSEPGVVVDYGRVKIKTEKMQKSYKVTLDLPTGADIRYGGTDEIRSFTAAATPYKFSLTNVENNNINIEEISGR